MLGKSTKRISLPGPSWKFTPWPVERTSAPMPWMMSVSSNSTSWDSTKPPTVEPGLVAMMIESLATCEPIRMKPMSPLPPELPVRNTIEPTELAGGRVSLSESKSRPTPPEIST